MLNTWKQRHQVSDRAMEELITVLCGIYGPPADSRASFVRGLKTGVIPTGDSKEVDVSEAVTQKRVRLAFQNKYKAPLWRNNVGGDREGNRWGLANESRTQNAVIKSSDLIGITPEKVSNLAARGVKKVGVFTSLEVKKGGWVYSGAPREKAQLRWLELIKHLGGYAKFINDPKGV